MQTTENEKSNWVIEYLDSKGYRDTGNLYGGNWIVKGRDSVPGVELGAEAAPDIWIENPMNQLYLAVLVNSSDVEDSEGSKEMREKQDALIKFARHHLIENFNVVCATLVRVDGQTYARQTLMLRSSDILVKQYEHPGNENNEGLLNPLAYVMKFAELHVEKEKFVNEKFEKFKPNAQYEASSKDNSFDQLIGRIFIWMRQRGFLEGERFHLETKFESVGYMLDRSKPDMMMAGIKGLNARVLVYLNYDQSTNSNATAKYLVEAGTQEACKYWLNENVIVFVFTADEKPGSFLVRQKVLFKGGWYYYSTNDGRRITDRLLTEEERLEYKPELYYTSMYAELLSRGENPGICQHKEPRVQSVNAQKIAKQVLNYYGLNKDNCIADLESEFSSQLRKYLKIERNEPIVLTVRNMKEYPDLTLLMSYRPNARAIDGTIKLLQQIAKGYTTENGCVVIAIAGDLKANRLLYEASLVKNKKAKDLGTKLPDLKPLILNYWS